MAEMLEASEAPAPRALLVASTYEIDPAPAWPPCTL
jgi:hypothetical protein